MSFFIRPFQLTDTETVIALWQTCNLTRSWNNPERDILRKLNEHPELFLVGEVAGRVVATCMAGYEGHRGWINYLAVHPDYQKQGYARQLMALAEERLLAMGCPKVNLQIRTDNLAAQAFYHAIGYKTDAVISLGKRLIEEEIRHD